MSVLVCVDFYGETVEAVRGEDGRVLVRLRTLCRNLGVDHSGQLKKLKEQPWACVEEISTHDTTGRRQKMSMIDLETTSGWLFTITAGKVKAEIRDKLIRYQKECVKVLASHFVPRPEGELTDPILAMVEAVRVNRIHQLELEKKVQVVERVATTASTKADRAMETARAAFRTLKHRTGFYTVRGYCNLIGRKCSDQEALQCGKDLAARMREQGETPQKVDDEKYGRINIYPQELLADYFGGLRCDA